MVSANTRIMWSRRGALRTRSRKLATEIAPDKTALQIMRLMLSPT